MGTLYRYLYICWNKNNVDIQVKSPAIRSNIIIGKFYTWFVNQHSCFDLFKLALKHLLADIKGIYPFLSYS